MSELRHSHLDNTLSTLDIISSTTRPHLVTTGQVVKTVQRFGRTLRRHVITELFVLVLGSIPKIPYVMVFSSNSLKRIYFQIYRKYWNECIVL